jgi:hypothetical protein
MTTAAKKCSRIRARRDNLPLSSEITNQVISVCGTLLGFGAAGVGLSVGFADKIRQLPPIGQKIIVAAGIVYSGARRRLFDGPGPLYDPSPLPLPVSLLEEDWQYVALVLLCDHLAGQLAEGRSNQ